VGAAIIFAGFINNKVPVYMPHLLLGFSLAAGFLVSEAAAFLPGWSAVPQVLVALYALAGVAYYEKWYSSARKSELVPYENTVATLRALMPPGPKYLYASPQFWPPFHDEASTTFLSFAAGQPVDAGGEIRLQGAADDKPVVLLVDEVQWLPELAMGASPPTSWQRDWVRFIQTRCALDAFAPGTAYGTMALYVCGLAQTPHARDARIVGGAEDLAADATEFAASAAELAKWTEYDDPRRTAAARPSVSLTAQGVRISGSGWPGIVKMFEATPGERYLVRTRDANTRDGDLLYLGTWQQPQVRSLSGASSSGIAVPLIAEPWFPHDRAFIATAPRVRVLVYSEAASTDFLISSLEILRLRPTSGHTATAPR
jgi:hypothetical protein